MIIEQGMMIFFATRELVLSAEGYGGWSLHGLGYHDFGSRDGFSRDRGLYMDGIEQKKILGGFREGGYGHKDYENPLRCDSYRDYGGYGSRLRCLEMPTFDEANPDGWSLEPRDIFQ